MGGGGTGAVSTMGAKGPYHDANAEVRLQYPRNSRLLLGSLANVNQPGFLKALQTEYPVELSIECRDMIGARARGFIGRRPRFPVDLRPFAVFFFKAGGGGNPWQLIGRTETVLHDEFCRFVAKVKLSCPTAEDRAKEIRVELFNQRTTSGLLKEQQFLGAVESSVEAISAEPLFRKELELQKSRALDGCLMVLSADIIRPSLVAEKFTMNVDFSSITKGAARVFYVLSRQLPSGDFTPVYRSEILAPEQKRFASMTRQVDALTAGIEDKLLRLDMYQMVGRRGVCLKLGLVQTSLRKMARLESNNGLLWWPATNETNHPDFVDIGRVVMLETDTRDNHYRFLLRVTQ